MRFLIFAAASCSAVAAQTAESGFANICGEWGSPDRYFASPSPAPLTNPPLCFKKKRYNAAVADFEMKCGNFNHCTSLHPP